MDELLLFIIKGVSIIDVDLPFSSVLSDKDQNLLWMVPRVQSKLGAQQNDSSVYQPRHNGLTWLLRATNKV